MDKREIGQTFRARLALLAERFSGNHARFAETIGLDRSALSQLLSSESTRLPRAETLCRIAEAHQVSLDWLLGLSQSETMLAAIGRATEIERIRGDDNQTLLDRWHREAIGYKIRYVPVTIPDPLVHPDLIAFRYRAGDQTDIDAAVETAHERLAYTRRPETDMEVCMPRQDLEALARGEGPWRGFPLALRSRQFAHMAALIDELYPTFRLFLFDRRAAYSAPYTVFGPIRVAVYVGDMYLVVNTTEHIRAFTRHFDDLIRRAEVPPDRAGAVIDRIASEALAAAT